MTREQVMTANREAQERGVLSVWTIYERPRDYPDGYIARRHEVGGGPRPLATGDTVTGGLEEIRRVFWGVGLAKLSRSPDDEPQIVESWV